MTSPPKPWERAGSAATSTATAPLSTTMTASTPVFPDSSAAPSLPDRPNTLNSVVNQTASAYTNPATANNPYNSAYSSAYSSPYSRMGGYGGIGGGMGSMYGSGYGGMGGGMGGYGMGGYGGMGGMGGYGMGGGYGGMGMGGMMPGGPQDQSLTQTWNQSTAATFQVMESIVRAFGGFAQMLESAFMTTHSSFFAMVSMAEQLGNLRHTLGSILGIYTLLRWMRTLLAKITGRPPPADATSLTPAAFSSFISGTPTSSSVLPDGTPAGPRPSRKPFIMFAIAVFGLPYLMTKLIRSMAASQEEANKRQQSEMGITIGPNGESIPLDPKKLEFCRVLYDYTPATQSVGMDLAVRKGDLVAILSKSDPMGQPSEWWQCRSRDGKIGYLPSPYLQVIQKSSQRQQQAIMTGSETASAPGSRTTTLKGSDGLDLEERTRSLSSVLGPEVKGRPGDISAESFQKSAFYS